MPGDLKDTLNDSIQDLLKVSFGENGLKDVDSATPSGDSLSFPALHFSCYNRNSTKVSNITCIHILFLTLL